MSTPAVAPSQTLAQAVRAKYPGAYDDMDDYTLESKVLSKYPQYSDFPRTPGPEKSTAQIGQQQSGVLPWLKNLEGDIRYGTNTTGPGSFLHKLGMQPTSAGVGKQSDMLATPITGPIHAAQGAAELPSHPWQGTKDLVGGIAETATLPSMVAAPEAAEAASRAPGFLRSLLPSTERAGQAFQDVMSVAKNNPVRTMDSLSDALSNYQKLVDAGGSQSLSVRKLLNRVTDPSKGPLTYEEARNFYSNLSRLSADEANRLTPVMKRQVGAVTQALGDTIQRTATLAGKGQEYSGAMKEYAKAKRLEDFTDFLKGSAVNAAKYGVPTAVGGAAAGYITKKALNAK